MRSNCVERTVLAIGGMAICCFMMGCGLRGRNYVEKEAVDMYYIVETGKSFDDASKDLEAAVASNGFGVLHIHDLGATLRKKGVDFEEQCKVFEICNPKQAGKVLSSDMRMNMALPCRISVFTEKGKTKIGMIRPRQMLASMSDDPFLAEVADEVEAKTVRMIEEAK